MSWRPAMPRDASFGFVAGVAAVIVIGVLCCRSQSTSDGAAGSVRPRASQPAAGEGPERASWERPSPVPGVPSAPRLPRSHKVQEGETLSSLAVRYYGDASRATLLFRANRSQ